MTEQAEPEAKTKTFIKANDFLFVYGTLRKGERADLSKSQKNFDVEFISKDSVNGLLYHLGAFPGLKLTTKTAVVVGETFLVKSAAVGAILDAYEGYPNLYQRSQIPAKSGRLVWVYTYNYPVTEDQLIQTGDWKNPRLVCSRQVPSVEISVGRR